MPLVHYTAARHACLGRILALALVQPTAGCGGGDATTDAALCADAAPRVDVATTAHDVATGDPFDAALRDVATLDVTAFDATAFDAAPRDVATLDAATARDAPAFADVAADRPRADVTDVATTDAAFTGTCATDGVTLATGAGYYAMASSPSPRDLHAALQWAETGRVADHLSQATLTIAPGTYLLGDFANAIDAYGIPNAVVVAPPHISIQGSGRGCTTSRSTTTAAPTS